MYSHDVVYAGAPISIVDATKSGGKVIGFRIVPVLAAGETPKSAYAGLKISYSQQTTDNPAGGTRNVDVAGPDWVAAFGGGHQIIAGENGRTYRVWIAEACKELEFPIRPELEGFAASSSSGSGSLAITSKDYGAGLSVSGAEPMGPGDGVSVAGGRRVRVSVVPKTPGATLNLAAGNNRLKAYHSPDAGVTWRRMPDLDLQIAEATTATVRPYGWPPLELAFAGPNDLMAWIPDAVTISAGTQATVTTEVLS